MSEHRQYSTLAVTESLQPMVPVGDNLEAASDVLNNVLNQSAAFADDLRAIANQHVEAAPASAEHVRNLSGAVARAVLDWIEQWPS